MHRLPSGAILVHHLVWVGNPFYYKGSLPLWGQLVGTLWGSGEHKDEAPFSVWVGVGRSWRRGQLLVGQGETLPKHLNVSRGVVERRGSAGIVLEIWRKDGLSASGDH